MTNRARLGRAALGALALAGLAAAPALADGDVYRLAETVAVEVHRPGLGHDPFGDPFFDRPLGVRHGRDRFGRPVRVRRRSTFEVERDLERAIEQRARRHLSRRKAQIARAGGLVLSSDVGFGDADAFGFTAEAEASYELVFVGPADLPADLAGRAQRVASDVDLRLFIEGKGDRSPRVMGVSAGEAARLMDDAGELEDTNLAALFRTLWTAARGPDEAKTKGAVSLQLSQDGQRLGGVAMPSLDDLTGRPGFLGRVFGADREEGRALAAADANALAAAFARADALRRQGDDRAWRWVLRVRADDALPADDRELLGRMAGSGEEARGLADRVR